MRRSVSFALRTGASIAGATKAIPTNDPRAALLAYLDAALLGLALTPLLRAADLVRDLVILNNRIHDNLRNPFTEALLTDAQFIGRGGISLAVVEAATISGNHIYENGPRAADPVCGVFVGYGDNLEITDNVLAANGTTEVVLGEDGSYRIGRVVEIQPAGEEPGLHSRLNENVTDEAVKAILSLEQASGQLEDKRIAEALAETGLSADDVRQHSAVIRRHVERLAALISDLLELARLEESGFAPHREHFPAADLLNELAREWLPRAEDRGLSLVVAAAPEIFVDGDRGLLRQALTNLLENAVKYCRPGDRIEIATRELAGGVELSVSDTGPGIPYPDQPRVFERFYRVDKGRSREQGGTGLGLSIVRHVAEAHDGRATLESRPGAGATFRIIVPARSEAVRPGGTEP